MGLIELFIALLKPKAKQGYAPDGEHAIRKDYKFVKVEFKSVDDGVSCVINTKNPFFIANLSHYFDSVQNEDQTTILKKSKMSFDSPDFDKWLKSFDESIIQLELVRK